MLTLLLENDGIRPDDAAMIGDRLDTDISCAHRAGMLALLVTTGVTNAETGRAATGEYRPDSIYADLREVVADAVEES
jgi:ribonucleotide monophosphatase NagD (HAD superfamily)